MENDRYPADDEWKLDSCPLTNRPFCMWVRHPEQGWVPTYGGPRDSYTIPTIDLKADGSPAIEEGGFTYTYLRYDHDEGYWTGDVYSLNAVLVSEERMCDYSEANDILKSIRNLVNPS